VNDQLKLICKQHKAGPYYQLLDKLILQVNKEIEDLFDEDQLKDNSLFSLWGLKTGQRQILELLKEDFEYRMIE